MVSQTWESAVVMGQKTKLISGCAYRGWLHGSDAFILYNSFIAGGLINGVFSQQLHWQGYR